MILEFLSPGGGCQSEGPLPWRSSLALPQRSKSLAGLKVAEFAFCSVGILSDFFHFDGSENEILAALCFLGKNEFL